MTAAFRIRSSNRSLIVHARRTRPESYAGNVVGSIRGLTYVEPERDARSGQQVAQATDLVLGECVHRIHNDGYDARCCVLIADRQATADDRIEESLGLS